MTNTANTSETNVERNWLFHKRRNQFKELIETNGAFRGNDKAALQLHFIIREIEEKHDIHPSDVARRAWPRENSTKRLYKLTLSPQQTTDQKRLKNLQKRPKAYWEAAKAAAICSGLDEDAFLLRLFEGTEIDERSEKMMRQTKSALGTAVESFIELSGLIAGMTESVARRCGLAALNHTIATTSGRFNVHEGEINRSGPRDCLLAHGPLADSFEVVDEWPPIPSVALYQIARCPPFDSVLRLAPEPLGKDAPFWLDCRDDLPETKTARWKRVPVQVKCWREVRLAIGPGDASLRPRPLFELRTVFELSAKDEAGNLQLLTPWLYDDLYQHVVVRLQEKLHTGRIDLRPLHWASANDQDASSLPSIPLDWPMQSGMQTLQPEHPYATWRSVTPDLCRELLDLPGSAETLSLLPFEPTGGATMTPSGSIAALVELAVVSGSLEKTLEQEAMRLASLVNDYRASQQEEALKSHDAARRRWNTQQEI